MNQVEKRLDSREVAEMMEIEHSNLIKKIDKINEDFRKVEINFSKYWKESFYNVEGQTRNYRNFLITKKGCEFLAHKTTGTKGNLFTDKYMDRFEQMEKQIMNPAVPSIDLANQMISIAQGTQVMGQVVQGMLGTINSLQVFVQDSIQAKDKQIDDIAELIGIRSKNINTLIGTLKRVIANKYGVFNVTANMDIYKKSKYKIFREFHVSKWEDIPASKYNSVQAFIEECL